MPSAAPTAVLIANVRTVRFRVAGRAGTAAGRRPRSRRSRRRTPPATVRDTPVATTDRMAVAASSEDPQLDPAGPDVDARAGTPAPPTRRPRAPGAAGSIVPGTCMYGHGAQHRRERDEDRERMDRGRVGRDRQRPPTASTTPRVMHAAGQEDEHRHDREDDRHRQRQPRAPGAWPARRSSRWSTGHAPSHPSTASWPTRSDHRLALVACRREPSSGGEVGVEQELPAPRDEVVLVGRGASCRSRPRWSRPPRWCRRPGVPGRGLEQLDPHAAADAHRRGQARGSRPRTASTSSTMPRSLTPAGRSTADVVRSRADQPELGVRHVGGDARPQPHDRVGGLGVRAPRAVAQHDDARRRARDVDRCRRRQRHRQPVGVDARGAERRPSRRGRSRRRRGRRRRRGVRLGAAAGPRCGRRSPCVCPQTVDSRISVLTNRSWSGRTPSARRYDSARWQCSATNRSAEDRSTASRSPSTSKRDVEQAAAPGQRTRPPATAGPAAACARAPRRARRARAARTGR